MGAKTWMLVYCKGDPVAALGGRPAIDREATADFAKRLFPSEKLLALQDGDLSNPSVPDSELLIGCFPGLVIVAAKEFAVDKPSSLPSRFLEACPDHTVYLHTMYSVMDWFAYAIWKHGKLVRSLSIVSDRGIVEDIGSRLPFELPYWDGTNPVVDRPEKYPFDFHPLDLGEAVLLSLFGYQLESDSDAASVDPSSVPLLRFKRKRSWFGFL